MSHLQSEFYLNSNYDSLSFFLNLFILIHGLSSKICVDIDYYFLLSKHFEEGYPDFISILSSELLF